MKKIRSLLKQVGFIRRLYLKKIPKINIPTELGSVQQIQLKLEYQNLKGNHPKISDIGFKIFSQSDEDGILLYLFSVIGTNSKVVAEVCAGNGIECCSTNLIINHGWHGVLIDGDKDLLEQGTRFYQKHRNTYMFKGRSPLLKNAWVTRDNIDQLIPANADLLIVDLDGIDYWAWQAVTARPRVVVVEYKTKLGLRSVTAPYSPNFSNEGTVLYGASLPALVKLGQLKGYRFVGANRGRYNAFFVREDLGLGIETANIEDNVTFELEDADLAWEEV